MQSIKIYFPFCYFQLDQKELELNHQKKEQKRTQKKFITQISQERNANTELSERLKEQEEERVRMLHSSMIILVFNN